MKILVVDDEQLVRWFLERALRKSGHEILTASNISEAAARLDEEKVDLLFLDLRMPEGNGTELIRRLEKVENGPRIVVCSAYVTADLEEEFQEKGICILKKPFKLDELESTLKKCAKG